MTVRQGDLTAEEIRNLLQEIDNESDDSMTFRVIQHDPALLDHARPLMLIIHPGDMIESERIEDALYMQQGLASEMSWKPDHDLVILHRNSCSQIGNLGGDYCEYTFADQFEADWPRATILHGDDLDAASAWMISNLGLETRPEIFMGGAYGGLEYGCLTAVGRNVEIVAQGKIRLSKNIPLGEDKAWVPKPAPAPSSDHTAEAGQIESRLYRKGSTAPPVVILDLDAGPEKGSPEDDSPGM